MIHTDKLVEYIQKNRRGYAFVDFNYYDIMYEISLSIRHLALIVDCDENENIFGVATGTPNYNTHTMYVKQILTTRKSTLQ